MEVSILGCSGGKTPKRNLTSFLLDGRLLIDAGAVSEGLTLDQQLYIAAILFTHAHLDHICGLAHLMENTRDQRHQPLDVYAPPLVIEGIKTHLLIPEVMPGYRDDNGEPAGVRFHPIVMGETFIVESYEVEAVKVNHPAGGVGYFISDTRNTFANTGDTGETQEFWDRYQERGDVDILITEVSFPNNMQSVADLSHHLTPQRLLGELKKAGITAQQVYLSHLKPAYLEQLEKEITAIEGFKLSMLQDGEVIRARKKSGGERPSRQAEVEAKVADKMPVFDYAKDLYTQRETLSREFGLGFKSGDIIFEEGDNSRIMYIIQEGRVRIMRVVQGVEKTLSLLGPGEFFGEMAVLNNRPRSATAEAVTDVRVLAFDKPAFERLVTENYGIAIKLIRTLAQRLQDADVLIENLMYIDPESKLTNTLIRCAMDEGIETKRGFLIRTTPEELAVRTGVRMTTLREVLAQLVRLRLVVVKKDTITIPDLRKLHRYLHYLELRDEFPAGVEL